MESILKDLPWIDVSEGEPFQIPSTFPKPTQDEK